MPSSLSSVLERLGWILAAGALDYFLHVPSVFARNAHGLSVYILAIGSLTFVALNIYLLKIYPQTLDDRGRPRGPPDFRHWQRDFPRSIQIATVAGGASIISAVGILWSQFWLLAPVIVFLNIVGVVSFIGLF
ncbi:hypothetical protein BJ742DRAFT_352642 [Cladochytrium replicatum]|nr:hypothetical protein BJ742DRAFT_352642 [Cladochytrium replicatum]